MGSVLQVFLAQLWLLLKITIKRATAKLLELGHNPDATPFAMLTFDACSSVASSFLFLSCSNISSVFSIFSIDMVENMTLALRVVGLIQES